MKIIISESGDPSVGAWGSTIMEINIPDEKLKDFDYKDNIPRITKDVIKFATDWFDPLGAVDVEITD